MNIKIKGKKNELKEGVTSIYNYLLCLASDSSYGVTSDEISEIENVLKEIECAKDDDLTVRFSLGHEYTFFAEEIGYEESLFPATKLMPTAIMSAYSEWEGPGDRHMFSLEFKGEKIVVKTCDWNADFGVEEDYGDADFGVEDDYEDSGIIEEEYIYTLVKGEWVIRK